MNTGNRKRAVNDIAQDQLVDREIKAPGHIYIYQSQATVPPIFRRTAMRQMFPTTIAISSRQSEKNNGLEIFSCGFILIFMI